MDSHDLTLLSIGTPMILMGDEMLEIAMARSCGYSGLALARYLDKQHQEHP